MSSHHNHDDVQSLYEGDQSKLYSGLMNHHAHDSVEGQASKDQVKRILKITMWLSIITIAEVSFGLMIPGSGFPKALAAFIFLALTLVKAALIVRVFMHLGDEKKGFVVSVLIPLALFVWFIIAFLADGHFWLHMNTSNIAR